MKKTFIISILLIFSVMITVITPAFAEHPSHRHHQQKRHEDGSSHHQGHRGRHHRDDHHKEVIIAGLFFMVMNEIQERNEAKEIINRTVVTLKRAQAVGQENNSYIGLGQALAHQERAQALFEKGKYREAINHTLWARAIALHFIDAPIPSEDGEDDWRNCDFRECDLVYSELTDTEANYMENSPSSVEMRESVNDIDIPDESVSSYEIK